MRVAILGNSGSGKSTLARWLATRSRAPVLDLDRVAWEPNRVAVPRPVDDATSDVRRFCDADEHWVVEGCYADLLEVALEFGPRLIFLNPGEAQCLTNCQGRVWEPHKYPSKETQDARLAFLLLWVRDYYTRTGTMSLAGHRACYAAYPGPKTEMARQPDLTAPTPEILAWLR